MFWKKREKKQTYFVNKHKKLRDKINTNYYILLIGYLNARNGNQKRGKIVGTNKEPIINILEKTDRLLLP